MLLFSVLGLIIFFIQFFLIICVGRVLKGHLAIHQRKEIKGYNSISKVAQHYKRRQIQTKPNMETIKLAEYACTPKT